MRTSAHKSRRGRHRKPRTRRFPLRHFAAVALAALLVAIPSTASGDTDHAARSVGTAEKVELPPAPYHDGNPWPVDDPILCLVDQTELSEADREQLEQIYGGAR